MLLGSSLSRLIQKSGISVRCFFLHWHRHAFHIKVKPLSLPMVLSHLPSSFAVLASVCGFCSVCPAHPGQSFPWFAAYRMQEIYQLHYQPVVGGLLFLSAKVSVTVRWHFPWKITVEGMFMIAFRVRKIMVLLWLIYLILKLNSIVRTVITWSSEKGCGIIFKPSDSKWHIVWVTHHLCFRKP